MSGPEALPIGQQLALDILAPPALTLLWWLLSKANAYMLRTNNSLAVQGWIEDGWKYLLITLYVLVFSVTAYAYFTK